MAGAGRDPLLELSCVAAPADGVAPALLLSWHRGRPHTTPVQVRGV
jgi:hypothetical protein